MHTYVCTFSIQAILLILLLFLRKRVKLTVAVFREAGSVIGAMPFMLVFPFWVSVVRSG